MRTHPFIEVSVTGREVHADFYNRLVSATITDAPGQDADSVEIRLDDARNELTIPAKGDEITVRFGFRDAEGGGQGYKMGVFILEQPKFEFGHAGEFVTLNGRSADMRDDIKEPLSEHFDAATLGDIVGALAERHGYEVKVSERLAVLPVPYAARVEQSTMDFLTRLADRHRAMFAIKDNKFLFLERGGLPGITIAKSECSDGDFTLNPRPLFRQTAGAWFDRGRAAWVFEDHATGLEGPTRRLRHALPSQTEARSAAQSDGDRAGRATASGSITLAGRPEVMADAPIILIGFRAEIDGLWRAKIVEHRYAESYLTTIELEAPEEGRQ